MLAGGGYYPGRGVVKIALKLQISYFLFFYLFIMRNTQYNFNMTPQTAPHTRRDKILFPPLSYFPPD